MWIAGIFLCGLVVDQATKAWALESLTLGEPKPAIGKLLQFNLVRNSGAAFSLLAGHTWIFTCFATLVLGAALFWFAPQVRVRSWAIVVGLFTAGISGNLIDRFLRPPSFGQGHVIDFLELPHWPIFNVADMCICAAAALVVVLSIVSSVGHDGKIRSDRES
ncbi:MAG: signal peptidase II [Propionibacteriaceae bacterium]